MGMNAKYGEYQEKNDRFYNALLKGLNLPMTMAMECDE